jgi:virginiamycin B lyase
VGLTDASLRGVAVGADRALWFTANASNKIGRMLTTGKMAGVFDIPTSASGARCIMAHSSGRLFFTEFDAGILAEIRLPRGWINA